MLVLFPRSAVSSNVVDPDFEAELRAAVGAGFTPKLYGHRAAAGGDVDAALAELPPSARTRRCLLRGWMLPGENYEALHRALAAKGYSLFTDPKAYEEAHYLPYAYRHIEPYTARSAWMEGDDVEQAWQLYRDFAGGHAIIKDWVKSAKSRWKEGCLIPPRGDEARFREIYAVFRATRGRLFNRGVVLREYMPVARHGYDIRGLPLIEETRLFFWKGEVVVRPQARYPSPIETLPRWEAVARRFSTPFMSIDVARLDDDTWRIIEVGDGGVSGLPMGLSPERFYERLWFMITIDS